MLHGVVTRCHSNLLTVARIPYQWCMIEFKVLGLRSLHRFNRQTNRNVFRPVCMRIYFDNKLVNSPWEANLRISVQLMRKSPKWNGSVKNVEYYEKVSSNRICLTCSSMCDVHACLMCALVCLRVRVYDVCTWICHDCMRAGVKCFWLCSCFYAYEPDYEVQGEGETVWYLQRNFLHDDMYVAHAWRHMHVCSCYNTCCRILHSQ